MKRIFLIFSILLISICSFSQITLSKEQIDSLPPAAKAAIQASVAKQEVKEQAKVVSEYAGLGKEVGEAVNGALGAVEDHVVSISKTDLGQTAIFIVCWKLLYKDIIGTITGYVLLTIMCVWMWVSIRFLKSSETFKNWDDDAQCTYVAVCGVGWFVLFVASMFCIF